MKNAIERIPANYRAWNGYIFSQRDADTYNAECERVERDPSQKNLDDRHRLFCIIISQSYDKSLNELEGR